MSSESYEVEPPPLPPMPEPVVEERPEVWGAWATIGIGILLAVIYTMAQSSMVFVFLAMDPSALSMEPGSMVEWAEGLNTNVGFLAAATVLGAAVGVPLVFLAAWLRNGLPVMEYLRVKRVSAGALLGWVLVTVLIVVGADFGTREFMQGGKGEAFMKATMESAISGGTLPLIYLAFVIAAPLAEEVFFRGFLFEGLMRSKAGAWGANVMTSLVWSVMHLQYGIPEMLMLFVGGLVFGYARVRTGSLVTPVVMHMVWNLSATVMAQLAYG